MLLSAKRVAAVLLAGLLANCSTPPPPPAQTAAVVPAPSSSIPVAQSRGQNCIDLSRIREAKVVDDRTIDFVLNGGQVLRNTLPNACPSLGVEKAFTYATSISQLCAVDTITVINQGGGIRTGASCGLGKFVPYTPPAPTSR
ncbi:hypothetical protein [Glacieibacterium sp.]|uniref:hypothetical protein n=1 Tax=Glacieibacterium sp. TaxID=2860237 RepID=UPI003B004246